MILLIIVVLTVFNIIIFVHELGHFWAAKWRGLQIDRFQIWFGKPIWKKEINGVQYGLGWIPAGGFVALPQMAPMEALEGGEKHTHPLPAITPLDKIIVAFAGPLFLDAAGAGLRRGRLASRQTRGFHPLPRKSATSCRTARPPKPACCSATRSPKSTACPVNGFAGSLDSITERIILSRGEEITYTVERPGVANPVVLEIRI